MIRNVFFQVLWLLQFSLTNHCYYSGGLLFYMWLEFFFFVFQCFLCFVLFLFFLCFFKYDVSWRVSFLVLSCVLYASCLCMGVSLVCGSFLPWSCWRTGLWHWPGIFLLHLLLQFKSLFFLWWNTFPHLLNVPFWCFWWSGCYCLFLFLNFHVPYFV